MTTKNHPENFDLDIARAAAAVRAAGALLITAGAGMGVDSGLPDFRGVQGFWRAYPALARLGMQFEEMAQPGWFERSPGLAWAFYGHRLNLYRATTPHAGFSQLLAAATAKPQGYFVFTSNVDGHFQKAGFAPERVLECHGSLNHFQCRHPCGEAIWDAPIGVLPIDEATFRALPPLPACPYCQSVARPNVLMFGDGTWNPRRTEAQESRLERWMEEISRGKVSVVVLEFGAGTAVPTVRQFSESVTRQLGGLLVRVNPREPEVPPGHVGLPLNAAAGIQRLLA